MEQNYFQTLCMGLYHNLGVALQAKQSDLDIKKYGNKFIIILDGEELTLYPANNGNPHDLYIGELDYMGTPQSLSAAILGDEQEIARVTQHQGDNIVESLDNSKDNVSEWVKKYPQTVNLINWTRLDYADEVGKIKSDFTPPENWKHYDFDKIEKDLESYVKILTKKKQKVSEDTLPESALDFCEALIDPIHYPYEKKINISESNGGPFAPFGGPRQIDDTQERNIAYIEGKEAYYKGLDSNDNPYNVNSNLSYAWFDGYEDAELDDESEFLEETEEFYDDSKEITRNINDRGAYDVDANLNLDSSLIKRVYEKGKQAFLQGKSSSENPYYGDGNGYNSLIRPWSKGWLDAKKSVPLQESLGVNKGLTKRNLILTFKRDTIIETYENGEDATIQEFKQGQVEEVFCLKDNGNTIDIQFEGEVVAYNLPKSFIMIQYNGVPITEMSQKQADTKYEEYVDKCKKLGEKCLSYKNWLKGKSIAENLLREIDDDKVKVKKSMRQYNDYTKAGKKIKSTDVFDIYLREDNRLGKIYTFVETQTKLPKGQQPMVYVYSIDKGNLSRGAGHLWARQELRSTSFAFHKDNPNKTAIPNDLKLALKIATNNLNNFRAKSKNNINEEAQIDADLDEIYAKGSAAYELGVEKEDNPYGYDDNVQAGVWEQGWESAQELDLKYGGKSAIAYQDALQEGLVIESRTLEAIYDNGIEDYYKGLKREENPYQDANDPDAPDNDNVYAGFWQEGWEAAAQQENPNWSNDFYNKPLEENKRVIREAKIKFEMTGSPKEDGYDTKSEFTNLLDTEKVEHTNIKNADVLVMGDWSPNNIKQHRGEGGKFTSKMSNKADYAKKHGIKTMSYKDFAKKYGKKNIKESIDTQGQQGINESNQQYFILRHKNKVTGDHNESHGMSREDAMTELGLWKKYIESGNQVPHEGYQPDLIEKWVNGDDVYWIEPVKQSKMKPKKLSEEQQLVYLDGAEAAQVGLNSWDNPHTNGDFNNYKLWEEGFKSDGKLLVENEDRDERLKNDQAKKLKQFSFDDFKGNAAYKNLLASGFKENYIGFKTASEQLIELTNDKVKLDLYFYPTHSIMDENKKKYVIFFRIEPKYQKIFEIRSTGESKAKKQKLITTACTFIIEKLKQKKLIHESFVEYEVEDDMFVTAVTNWYKKNKDYYEDYSDLLYHFSEAFPGHDISELEAIVEDVDNNDAKFMKDMEDWHSKRYPTNNTDDDEDWTDPAGGVHSADDKEPWKMYESLNKLIDKKLLTESSRHHFVMGGVNGYALKHDENTYTIVE